MNKVSTTTYRFFVAYCYALVAALWVEVPTFLIVRHFWRITLQTSIAAGLISGLLAHLLFLPINANYSYSIFKFGLMGAISGLVFLLIWRAWARLT